MEVATSAESFPLEWREPLHGYKLAEILYRYRVGTRAQKLALIQRVARQFGIPYELAELATTDPDEAVRVWYAEHGPLDFRESYRDGDGHCAYRHPERYLGKRLKECTEPFARLVVHQNSDFPGLPDALRGLPGEDEKGEWERASHVERLAMVRKDNVNSKLMRNVFDLKNDSLGVDMAQRTELIQSFFGARSDRRQVEKLSRSVSNYELDVGYLRFCRHSESSFQQ
jgi:hypothetical protein